MGHRARYIAEVSRWLGVLMIMLGTFTVAGCYLDRTIDQATASDVNNRSFTFSEGAVFHSALDNVSTTLSFTDNATTFRLSSSGGMASGTNKFDSCILTVTSSTYGSAAGPQVGNVIKLDPCDFDSDTMRLTVENRGITVTSAKATSIDAVADGTGNQATASDVNNHSFTFANGAVFHSGLTNVSTALAFTENATAFRLSSSRGTAMGTNRFGSCILTVTTSTYAVGDGPQADSGLTLNPCDFNDANNTLTVTRGSITATSASGTVITP